MYGLDFLVQESNDVRNNFAQNKVPIQRESNDKSISAYGTQMIQFCKLSNLYIINGRMGRHTHNAKDKSVIDYYFCSPPLFNIMYGFDVLEFSSLYSDAHCPISFALRTHRSNLNEVRDGSNSDKTTIRLWNPKKSNCFNDNFNMAEISDINSKLSSMKIKTCLQQSEMDDIVMRINQVFQNCAEESFGHAKQGRKTQDTDMTKKPWFKDNCHRARNQYHNARRRYNINNSEHSKQILKQAKNECQAPLNDLYNYFKNVNGCSDDTRGDADHYNSNNENEELNKRISESEVRVAINHLNNNKSAGIDNIKNEHIKCTSCLMIPIYTKLFNLIFDTAIIPDSWSIGVIKPIYKKGDPTLPQNYRPITILSCLGKLFTSVINNRLKNYADKFYITEQCQAGFRQNYSTADNIFMLKSVIDIAKANKSKLFSCFIDFKQAFDTVWRSGLWHKLNEYDINGKCSAVIQSIYKNVKSKVATEEWATIYFPCLTGVRQGENLSPVLFSIFVNDLNHFYVKKSKWVDM